MSGSGPGAGPAPFSARNSLQVCQTKLTGMFHEVVTYQPANRYWTFQWYELAIYVAVALVLSALCVWWVRRRLA